MDKDSVLYLLMDMRVNGILDRILEKDEEYQGIARKSFEYLNSDYSNAWEPLRNTFDFIA